MRVIVRLGCIFLLFAFVGICNADETIRLAGGEWPPYQSRHLKYDGVVSRIVTEAFALGGIKVEYGYFPWKRSYTLAEIGEWDGTLAWFDLPERRKDFYISDPVIDTQYVFFHRKGMAFDWKDISDLKNLRIGGTLGYDYGKAFQSAEKDGKIRIIRKPSEEENLIRLYNDKIQIFPCDVEVGYYIIREKFGPDKIDLFTHHPKPLKVAPHHVLLSKKIKRNKQLVEIFNKGLKQLKASGKYDQYLDESRRGEQQK
ncbi:MAG: transporter substrate-binding domain-containing protein [Desulfobacteraceae bacterium]|nr:transporter substrate-binding domain-containing protein [Desulfobacteraceae bacterium]